MPLQPFGFIGGSYQSWSPYADAQVSMNLLPEAIESQPAGLSQGSTKPGALALYGTPGLTQLGSGLGAGIRGMFTTGDGRVFIAAGTLFVEIFRGVLSTSGTAVTWVSGSKFTQMTGAGTFPTNLSLPLSDYQVLSVSDSTDLVLTATAGTQTNVPFFGSQIRGTIANDSLPVSICSNGTQLLIVTAGLAYVDAGTAGVGPVASVYQNGSGTVKTSGTAVTWISGSKFDASNVISGSRFIVAGTTYSTNSVGGPTSLTLNGTVISAATNTNPVHFTTAVAPPTGASITISGFTGGWTTGNNTFTVTNLTSTTFSVVLNSTAFGAMAGAPLYSPGTQDTAYSGTCNTVGTAVTWASGSTFDATLQAALVSFATSGSVISITIAAVVYTIASITDTTHLVLTSSAGTAGPSAFSLSIGVAYLATYPVTAASGAFLDGYFIVAAPNSRQINISALNNGLLWNPIDNAIKAAAPDNITTIFVDHETLYLLGLQTAEAWQNTGAAAFPLQRNPGGFIHCGDIAPNSTVRLGEGIAWLAGDPRGQPVAMHAVGFSPTRVSTSAIEAIWLTYSTVADAIAYSYVEQGHSFWVINFPTGNATWVWDLITNLWHQRGHWNGSSNDQHLAIAHAYGFGSHIVGDSTGNFYVQSMATYTDNGTQITRVRAARLPSGNGDEWSYASSFRLIAENPAAAAITAATNDVGGAVLTTAAPPPAGTSVTISGFTGSWAPANGVWTTTLWFSASFKIPINSIGFGAMTGSPVVLVALNPSLDYSLDGGRNFIGARTAAPPLVAGAFGFFDWRRLGRHRDRVMRVTITAAVKVALIAGDVDVE